MHSAGHRAKKQFGQNFLVDKKIIQAIVNLVSPEKNDRVLEIGPGLGALTEAILPFLLKLTVVELDRDLVARLEARKESRLHIISGDALAFNIEDYFDKEQTIRIIGNLPYNISTPLIFHFLKSASRIQDMHFMLQKEVVERIIARPGNKAYGRLSVMVQYYCQVEKCLDVPPHAFSPMPKVESAIIRLRPFRDKPFTAENEQGLSELVKEAFSHRRKTLKNNLIHFKAEVFDRLGIEPSRRPETLSVEEYVKLANQKI